MEFFRKVQTRRLQKLSDRHGNTSCNKNNNDNKTSYLQQTSEVYSVTFLPCVLKELRVRAAAPQLQHHQLAIYHLPHRPRLSLHGGGLSHRPMNSAATGTSAALSPSPPIKAPPTSLHRVSPKWGKCFTKTHPDVIQRPRQPVNGKGQAPPPWGYRVGGAAEVR